MLLERNNLEKEGFKKVDGPDIENPSRIFKYLLLPIQSSDKFGVLALSPPPSYSSSLLFFFFLLCSGL
jgi:hypothetical protein